MDCSLYALLACLSWSNVYVDGGLSLYDTALPHQVFETRTTSLPRAVETITTQYTSDKPSNPYGRLSVGYEFRFDRVSLAIEASHTSSIETNADRGINALSIKARWYPFRH